MLKKHEQPVGLMASLRESVQKQKELSARSHVKGTPAWNVFPMTVSMTVRAAMRRGSGLAARRAMTHCSQCNEPLIQTDFYGECLIGCIECNRWTRDGWLFILLPEEDIEALKADRGPETIAKFLDLETGWTMLRDSGWYAYYNDKKPIGPFATEAEAARSGLQAWRKETAPGA